MGGYPVKVQRGILLPLLVFDSSDGQSLCSIVLFCLSGTSGVPTGPCWFCQRRWEDFPHTRQTRVSVWKREISGPWGQRYSPGWSPVVVKFVLPVPFGRLVISQQSREVSDFEEKETASLVCFFLVGPSVIALLLLMVAYLVLLERFLLNPGEE